MNTAVEGAPGETSQHTCAYVFSDGTSCPGEVEGEGSLCFWHDPKAAKDGADIKQRLEEWAQSGRSMEGFVLRQARLEGVRLHRGYDLRRADLWRANLQGASLFNLDLRGAQLLKTDFSRANLNHAKLEDADLLGVMLEGTKLEEVEWGEVALQEEKADLAAAEDKAEEAARLYKEAEEVYRNLRRTYDSSGYFHDAGGFFYREMVMRRKLMPRWSAQRIWSKLVDLVCGYGESPPRVLIFASLVIFGSAALYLLLGVHTPHGFLIIEPHLGLGENFNRYLTCVYYSLITYCTIGYGDILPVGYSRPVAVIEGFIGAFSMALFILVFSKKMTRS
ncbi:MAG: pentapeptide repeat-containing protein [Candidatus Latescibacteria bacterium]|nr:pentapeptide repeat-containing protein [Candidatus Latescibacterota bacterium]